ncbi:GGDEF domain-containing protein [Paraglaciecola polaris]|uniref:GGDEF domain-containing protein n=1 Tax=Paraglaciecola polaris TaxID=222814 RepID=UPI0030ECD715
MLSALAVQLKQVIRDSDIIARWGGEEFVVVCANTPLGEAMELAQRLSKGIAKHATAKKSLTISIGVAENCVGDSAESLLDRADNALYRAKREGRNQVFMA